MSYFQDIFDTILVKFHVSFYSIGLLIIGLCLVFLLILNKIIGNHLFLKEGKSAKTRTIPESYSHPVPDPEENEESGKKGVKKEALSDEDQEREDFLMDLLLVVSLTLITTGITGLVLLYIYGPK